MVGEKGEGEMKKSQRGRRAALRFLIDFMNDARKNGAHKRTKNEQQFDQITSNNSNETANEKTNNYSNKITNEMLDQLLDQLMNQKTNEKIRRRFLFPLPSRF